MKYLLGFILATIVNSAIADSISSDSYSGVKIGMPVAEALSNLDGYESNAELYDSEACYYLVPKNNEPGVLFMVVDGVIGRIDVYSKEVRVTTSENLGIGSKKKDILSKYENVKVSPHPYIAPEGEYLEVKLKNGNGIIFETDNDIVTSFRVGSYPAIQYIEGCL